MAYKEVEVKQPLMLTILPYVSIIAFFALWELVVQTGFIPDTLLAAPSTVAKTFIVKLHDINPDGATMGTHAWTSIQEAFLGYALSLLIGIPLGLCMGWFKVVEGLCRPIFELIRPIPPIAWIPLTVFWFGIGLTGKVFIIWIAGIVPCVINSYTGIKLTSQVLIDVSRTFGAPNWLIFWKIGIPSSLPMVFAGIRVALGNSWSTLVAAEMLAASAGLGYMIQIGRTVARPDIVIVGMVVIGAIGAILSAILSRCESYFLRWKVNR